MEIFERVKILRKDYLKLTQSEFGKRLGVSRDVIKNMELEIVDVKEHFIKLICKEFNVNETWLRTGEGDIFDTLSDDEETIALIADLCASGNKYKLMALRAAAKIIEDDHCWRIIEAELKKLIDPKKE